MKRDIENIVKRAIDLYVHIGPEVIPRKYTVEKLIREEEGKIAGMALKNHFYPTMPLIKSASIKTKLKLFGGLALNNAVGGLNSEALYASALITDRALVVWLPTINAENFLSSSQFELAPEWIRQPDFQSRKAEVIKPVPITKKSYLTDELKNILLMIKDTSSVLATGHISWKETLAVVTYAENIGIKNIIVTHPIYQRISMPIEIQRQLVKKGAFIEHCYSMYSIDGIPIGEIAEAIKKIGSKYVILSSDVGQVFSPSPSSALKEFASKLVKKGISEEELYTMLVVNPNKLLNYC